MNRKELKREYRESARPMGVYRVRSTASGLWIIGASANVPARLNRHRFDLERGSHANRALQADWTRLGAANFTFETLDSLDPPDEPGYDPAEDLRVLEQMWAERLALSDGPGYEGGAVPGA